MPANLVKTRDVCYNNGLVTVNFLAARMWTQMQAQYNDTLGQKLEYLILGTKINWQQKTGTNRLNAIGREGQSQSQRQKVINLNLKRS